MNDILVVRDFVRSSKRAEIAWQVNTLFWRDQTSAAKSVPKEMEAAVSSESDGSHTPDQTADLRHRGASIDQTGCPSWVVLHIPHDSTEIPEQLRPQFLLSDAELRLEVQRMTDHLTQALFVDPKGQAPVIRAPVSRVVVDVERFTNDSREPMAALGMGAIYEVTSHLKPLRAPLSSEERVKLLRDWYYPHHERLEAAVDEAISEHGRCLVIDAHSFPGTALPYERAHPHMKRPDICIGTDPFHTPERLKNAFVEAFGSTGWRVAVNEPFAGAMVPASRYRFDPRVSAVMVEVNRDLYLDPASSQASQDFSRIAADVKRCVHEALAIWSR